MLGWIKRKMKAAFAAQPAAKAAAQKPARPSYGDIVAAKRRRAKGRRMKRKA